MRLLRINLGLTVSLALAVSGCGSAKLLNIAPRTEVTAEKLCCQTVTAEVLLAAEPFTDEDRLLSEFDGNVLLAGILPVRALIENRSSSPLNLKRADFSLVDGKGKQYKQLDPKHVLNLMVKYYEIGYQRKGSFKQTLDDLNAISLLQEPMLPANEQRQGYMYFSIDPVQPLPPDLRLIVKHLRPANGKKDIDINLSLSYVH